MQAELNPSTRAAGGKERGAQVVARAIGASEGGPWVLVDGSNVAWGGNSKPKLRNLVAVRERLRAASCRSVVIVDASLRHSIDDRKTLEDMIRQGEIAQVPAGRCADEFLQALAESLMGRGEAIYILSNDRFSEGHKPPIPRVTFLSVSLGDREEWLFSPSLESIGVGEGVTHV